MIISHDRRAKVDEIAAEMDRRGRVIEQLEERRDALVAKLGAVSRVRDGYDSQSKFADIDCAVHFREFVRRIDDALMA